MCADSAWRPLCLPSTMPGGVGVAIHHWKEGRISINTMPQALDLADRRLGRRRMLKGAMCLLDGAWRLVPRDCGGGLLQTFLHVHVGRKRRWWLIWGTPVLLQRPCKQPETAARMVACGAPASSPLGCRPMVSGVMIWYVSLGAGCVCVCVCVLRHGGWRQKDARAWALVNRGSLRLGAGGGSQRNGANQSRQEGFGPTGEGPSKSRLSPQLTAHGRAGSACVGVATPTTLPVPPPHQVDCRDRREPLTCA
jgi:hypothetical protein